MLKKNSFIKHFVTIGAGTIVNMFLGLITTPILTRLVDPTEYGQLSMFNTYTNIFVMVLSLGLDQALVRFFYDKEEITYKRALLRFCVLLPTIISLMAGSILVLVSYINGEILEFSRLIVVFLVVNVLVTLYNRFSLLALRLTYKSKEYAIAHVLHRVVYLIVAVALILTIRKEYLAIMSFCTWFSLLASTVIAVIYGRESWKLTESREVIHKKEIIKYSLPFIVSMGLTSIFQACDKLAIKHYCSYADVGIYASALTMIAVFAIIQTTFNTLWSPMMIDHLVNKPEDTSFIRKGNKYITVIMFLFGFSLILVKDVFALLLGYKYREAAYIMPFLVFNPIMYTISETTQAGIEYSKKSYLNVIVSLTSCVFNIIGNTILVPSIGPKGAAISTGLSYVVFFMMRTILSQKYYRVEFQVWKIGIMIAITSGYAYINTFYRFGIPTVVGYFFCVIILLALYNKDLNGLYNYVKREINSIIHRS